MSGQPNPHQRAQQLLQEARKLEDLSKGHLAGLSQRLYANKGKLSPDDEARLRDLVGKTRGEVQHLIQSILNLSGHFSGRQATVVDSVHPATRPDVTLGDVRIIPVPTPPAPVRTHSQVQSPNPEEAIPLSELPEGFEHKFQELLSNPQKFIDELLAPAFRGKYDELKYLARGGMGLIIKARQVNLNREVVIKLNTQMFNELMTKSFLKEGQNAAQLGFDPNVVAVIESDQAKVRWGRLNVLLPYHVLEYVKGAKDGTFLLRAMAEAKQAFPVEAALHFLKQYAKGLALAHEQKIVHRDVKPENVLVPPDEQALVSDWIHDQDATSFVKGLQEITGLKVADFGLAGVRSEQLQNERLSSEQMEQVGGKETITGMDRIIGTLYFIPPEGYNDSRSAGKPWDVYSLGLIFYMLLTGHDDPLKISKGIDRDKDNMRTYAFKILGKDRGPAIASAEKDPHIKKLEKDSRNKSMVEMLQRMTAFEPDERPTMEDVLQWIGEELDKRSEKTLRTKKAEKRAEEALKSKRTAKWIGGAIGVALLSVLAASPLVIKNKRRNAFLETQALTAQRIEQASRSRQWQEVVTLLEEQIRTMEQNRDFDAVEQADRLRPFREQLDRAKARLEHQQRARQLIAQGDASLHADGAAFQAMKERLGLENPEEVRTRLMDEAKRCYEEARGVGVETEAAAEAEQRLAQWHYQAGLRAYNRGQVNEAQAAFSTVQHTEVLRPEERTRAQQRLSVFRTWPQRKTEVDRRAAGIFVTRDRAAFVREVEALGAEAHKERSAEALAVLMKVQSHFDQMIAGTGNRDASIEESSQLFRSDAGRRELLARLELLRPVILRAYARVTTPLPESASSFQTFNYGLGLIAQAHMDQLLTQRNYDEAMNRCMDALEAADRLNERLLQEGRGFEPLEGMEAYLSTLIDHVMTSMRNKLTRDKKPELERRIRERFREGSFIRQRVANYLAQ